MVVVNGDTKKEKNKVTSNLFIGLFWRKVKKGISCMGYGIYIICI